MNYYLYVYIYLYVYMVQGSVCVGFAETENQKTEMNTTTRSGQQLAAVVAENLIQMLLHVRIFMWMRAHATCTIKNHATKICMICQLTQADGHAMQHTCRCKEIQSQLKKHVFEHTKCADDILYRTVELSLNFKCSDMFYVLVFKN